jgi:pimeloyl-ACP methyl ester carboxylesterase
MTRFSRSWWATGPLLLVLILATAQEAPSQIPIGMAPGLGEPASIWYPIQVYLTERLGGITTHPISLNTGSSIPSQSVSFFQQLYAQTGERAYRAILMGHSNGGLVVREVARITPPTGIITVGTPHPGARIVPAAPAGRAFAQNASYALAELSSAALEYVYYGRNARWSDWLWYWAAQEAINAALYDWVPAKLAEAVDNLTDLPAVKDVTPGSDFMRSLNDAPGGIVDQNVPARIGVRVSTYYSYEGGPLRLLLSPDEANTTAALASAAGFWLKVNGEELYWDTINGNFSDPNVFYARAHLGWAAMWFGSFLTDYDLFWCSMIHNGGRCGPSDAFIPQEDQRYTWASDFDAPIAYSVWDHRRELQDIFVAQVLTQKVQFILGAWY